MPWTVTDHDIGSEIAHALDVASAFHPEDHDLGPVAGIDVDSITPVRPDDLPEERDTWEQMPGESEKQFLYFRVFRDLGYTRSRTKVLDNPDVTCTRRYIDQLANDYFWDKRVKAWDRERERVYNAESFEHVREMAKRHQIVVASGIEALAVAFAPIVEEYATNPDRFIESIQEDLSTKQQFDVMVAAARTLPSLIDAERKIFNQPTEIKKIDVEHGGEVEIRKRSDLADILEILAGVNNLRGEGVEDDTPILVDSTTRVLDVGSRNSGIEGETYPEDE